MQREHTYTDIIKQFILYGESDENIRAVLIVGSRARQDKPADKWSDLDLVIFANNPDQLLLNTDWIERIDRPYITFLEQTAVGEGKERRVLFEDGLDVDFAVLPSKSINKFINTSEVQEVLSRGNRVLIDKDDITRNLINKTPVNNFIKPTYDDLINDINDFWYHAVWAAKKLCRGEILIAKSVCDGYMKQLLIKMIKLQSKIKNGVQFDTWHGYRFFEEWANPYVIDKFKNVFSYYDEQDIWSALKNTMILYREISVDVSTLLKYKYPHEADRFASDFIEKLQVERKM
ncbi:MAG TPA: aminoglycoside 6-adenylyltransferase [Rummeliibacillus sp.]|nr:aminoglycoside 6-adenylyltransferase [Rummeliibacillus sp.]